MAAKAARAEIVRNIKYFFSSAIYILAVGTFSYFNYIFYINSWYIINRIMHSALESHTSLHVLNTSPIILFKKQLSFTVKNPRLQLVKIDPVISVYLSLTDKAVHKKSYTYGGFFPGYYFNATTACHMYFFRILFKRNAKATNPKNPDSD